MPVFHFLPQFIFYQSNGGVSFDMEVQQAKQSDQVAEMQTAGSRIHATVDGCGTGTDVIYQFRAITTRSVHCSRASFPEAFVVSLVARLPGHSGDKTALLEFENRVGGGVVGVGERRGREASNHGPSHGPGGMVLPCSGEGK